MDSRSKWVKPLLFFSVIGHELPLARQVFVLTFDFRIAGSVGVAQTFCRLARVLVCPRHHTRPPLVRYPTKYQRPEIVPNGRKIELGHSQIQIGTKASDLGHYLPAPSSAVSDTLRTLTTRAVDPAAAFYPSSTISGCCAIASPLLPWPCSREATSREMPISSG
jgi:hypothetical protein